MNYIGRSVIMTEQLDYSSESYRIIVQVYMDRVFRMGPRMAFPSILRR